MLGYNSENNNYKPLPFDFSRASSATRVNKDGLIETVGGGKARIDFKDDSKGALLLEPSRTNLVLTSASGTYGNQPASETNTISPDGTNNAVIPTPDELADRYQYDVSSGTYATNTKLSYSWYRKRISTPIIPSYIGDLQMNVLVNVTQVGSTTQIESDVNGFDRFQAIFNITDGSASSIIRGYFGGAVGVGNSSVAYFGHQLEVGSYATSYIPTQGSAVTRLADTCDNGANEQVINSTEGVLYFEALFGQQESTSRYISINDESSSNRVLIGVSGGTNILRGFVFSGSVQQAQIIDTVDLSETLKLAISYKQNEIKFFKNGFQVSSTVTSAITPVGLSVLDFDDSMNAKFYGNVKEIKLYNTALTDARITSINNNINYIQ